MIFDSQLNFGNHLNFSVLKLPMIAEPDVLAKMVAEPGISRSFCGHLLCLWMFACHVLRVVRSLARLSRRRVCKFFYLRLLQISDPAMSHSPIYYSSIYFSQTIVSTIVKPQNCNYRAPSMFPFSISQRPKVKLRKACKARAKFASKDSEKTRYEVLRPKKLSVAGK